MEAPTLLDLCMNAVANPQIWDANKDWYHLLPLELQHAIVSTLNARQVMTYQMAKIITGDSIDIKFTFYTWLRSEKLMTSILRNINCKNLRTLKLENAKKLNIDKIIHDSFDQSTCKLLSLRILSLRSCKRFLSDEGLRFIAQIAPGLQSVNVGGCDHITNAGLSDLLHTLKRSLVELYVDECKKLFVKKSVRVIKSIQNLNVLHVSGNQGVDDEFVMDIAAAFGEQLKEVAVSSCGLTDVSLHAIGNTCPSLRSIDISNNKQMTDMGLSHLALACTSMKIVRMGNNQFSDHGVAEFLSVRGGGLTEISLDGSHKVGSKTASALSWKTKHLTTLDLSRCELLTERNLNLVISGCPLLKRLKIELIQCSEKFEKTHLNLISGESVPNPFWVGLKYGALAQ